MTDPKNYYRPTELDATEQARITKEREAKAIAAALEREPTWPPGAKAEVTWQGDHWSCVVVESLKHVVIKGTISLGELRCECGSGNHTRGPGHADYCQLLEKA